MAHTDTKANNRNTDSTLASPSPAISFTSWLIGAFDYYCLLCVLVVLKLSSMLDTELHYYFRHRILRKILRKYCIFTPAYAFCLNICVRVRIYQRPMPTCLFVYKILSIMICVLKARYIIAQKSSLVRWLCEKVLCGRLNYNLHWIRREWNAINWASQRKQGWERVERIRDAWETCQMPVCMVDSHEKKNVNENFEKLCELFSHIKST